MSAKTIGLLPAPIDLKNMSEGDIWITADLHLAHGGDSGKAGILKHEARPFPTIQKHNKALIKNIRAKVKEDDWLIILGDYVWAGPANVSTVEDFTKKIPGKKILVLGNHDRIRPFDYIEFGFTNVTTFMVLGDTLLAHDPAVAEVWPKNKPVLCGHIHSLFKKQRNVVNVGVDVWDFFLYVMKMLLRWLWSRTGQIIITY